MIVFYSFLCILNAYCMNCYVGMEICNLALRLLVV